MDLMSHLASKMPHLARSRGNMGHGATLDVVNDVVGINNGGWTGGLANQSSGNGR
jgi:hypothetical protein